MFKEHQVESYPTHSATKTGIGEMHTAIVVTGNNPMLS